MKVLEEDIREYIKNTSMRCVSNEAIKALIVAYIFVVCLGGIVPGIVIGGSALLISYILDSLCLIYIIFVIVFTRENKIESLSRRFLKTAIFGLLFGALFIITAIGRALSLETGNSIIVILIVISTSISLILFFFTTLRSIRKRGYNYKSKGIGVVFVSTLPPLVGMFLGKIFMENFSAQINDFIEISVCTALGISFLLFTINFVRYKWIKQYSILLEADEVIEIQRAINNRKKEKMEKKLIAKKKHESNSNLQDLKKHISDSKKY